MCNMNLEYIYKLLVFMVWNMELNMTISNILSIAITFVCEFEPYEI